MSAIILLVALSLPGQGFTAEQIRNLPKVEAPDPVPDNFFSRKVTKARPKFLIPQQRYLLILKAQQRRQHVRARDSVPTYDAAVEYAKAWAAIHQHTYGK